ncbi:antitoxin family protein [Archaeoglobus neptunius]|uniref:antitoxin family protein n=1 Tax=Archaeoglobus neptunius TaxID=2798580 RepID=UPI001925F395|nr:antitoxin family protein [Archaeoglobus neptunius]
MPKIIEAVYENGVFKPLQKVDLREGEKIKLRLEEEGIADIIRKYSIKVKQDALEEFLKERR